MICFTAAFCYRAVVRILPRHLRDLIRLDDVMTNHKRLGKLSQFKAQIDFLRLLQLWPLFGAVMFEIDVSITFYFTISSLWSILFCKVNCGQFMF